MSALIRQWPAYAKIEAPGFSFRVVPGARTAALEGGLPAQASAGPRRSIRRRMTAVVPGGNLNLTYDYMSAFLFWMEAPLYQWISLRDWDGQDRLARIVERRAAIRLAVRRARRRPAWAVDLEMEGPLEIQPAANVAEAGEWPWWAPPRAETASRLLPSARRHVMEDGAVMQRSLQPAPVIEHDISVELRASPEDFLRWALLVDGGEFDLRPPSAAAVSLNGRFRISGGAGGVEFVQVASRPGAQAWEARMTLAGLATRVA